MSVMLFKKEIKRLISKLRYFSNNLSRKKEIMENKEKSLILFNVIIKGIII
jgi:hypothetical protein